MIFMGAGLVQHQVHQLGTHSGSGGGWAGRPAEAASPA